MDDGIHIFHEDQISHTNMNQYQTWPSFEFSPLFSDLVRACMESLETHFQIYRPITDPPQDIFAGWIVYGSVFGLSIHACTRSKNSRAKFKKFHLRNTLLNIYLCNSTRYQTNICIQTRYQTRHKFKELEVSGTLDKPLPCNLCLQDGLSQS